MRIDSSGPDYREISAVLNSYEVGDDDGVFFIIGLIAIANRWSLTKSFRAYWIGKGISGTLAEVNTRPLPQRLIRANQYIKLTSEDDEVKEGEYSYDIDELTMENYPYIIFANHLIKGYEMGKAVKESDKVASKLVPLDEINAILAMTGVDPIEDFGQLWKENVDKQEEK